MVQIRGPDEEDEGWDDCPPPDEDPLYGNLTCDNQELSTLSLVKCLREVAQEELFKKVLIASPTALAHFLQLMRENERLRNYAQEAELLMLWLEAGVGMDGLENYLPNVREIYLLNYDPAVSFMTSFKHLEILYATCLDFLDNEPSHPLFPKVHTLQVSHPRQNGEGMISLHLFTWFPVLENLCLGEFYDRFHHPKLVATTPIDSNSDSSPSSDSLPLDYLGVTINFLPKILPLLAISFIDSLEIKYHHRYSDTSTFIPLIELISRSPINRLKELSIQMCHEDRHSDGWNHRDWRDEIKGSRILPILIRVCQEKGIEVEVTCKDEEYGKMKGFEKLATKGWKAAAKVENGLRDLLMRGNGLSLRELMRGY